MTHGQLVLTFYSNTYFQKYETKLPHNISFRIQMY